MAVGEGDNQLLVFAVGILIGTKLRCDFLRARNTRRQTAVAGRVLLDGIQHLLPLDELRLGRLERQDVRRGLRERLSDRFKGRTQSVDLVRGPEIQQLLLKLVHLAALALHIAMDLGNRLVAANLVLLIGEGLNGLRVGVGQVGAEGRQLRADRNRDDARVAHELKLGTRKGADDLLVRDDGRRTSRPVVLQNLRDQLLRPPVGNTRVEDFDIGGAEVRHGVGNRPLPAAHATRARAPHVHREFAGRLIDGRRNPVDGERHDQTDQQEDENRQPALGHDTQNAREGNCADDGRRLVSTLVAISESTIGATSVGTISSVTGCTAIMLPRTVIHRLPGSVIHRRTAFAPVINRFVSHSSPPSSSLETPAPRSPRRARKSSAPQDEKASNRQTQPHQATPAKSAPAGWPDEASTSR